MDGQERREKILDELYTSSVPLSGSALAKSFNVSRQVIVQDIALIRAAGHSVISTNRGYILEKKEAVSRVFKVSHTDEQVQEELSLIVDLGGTVSDVFVNHKVYGRLRVEMNIKCRSDIERFVYGIKSGKSRPLKNLTSNYHYHTVTAESEEILDAIENELEANGMLIR